MLLRSAAIVAKKLLVFGKIAACVKEMSPGCCMQSFKHCLVKHWLSILNFVLQVTYCLFFLQAAD